MNARIERRAVANQLSGALRTFVVCEDRKVVGYTLPMGRLATVPRTAPLMRDGTNARALVSRAIKETVRIAANWKDAATVAYLGAEARMPIHQFRGTFKLVEKGSGNTRTCVFGIP